jgi:para-nitrobenzyl esterase
MQIDINGDVIGSEDCLTLNIWGPSEIPDDPLPVMVFFHGGDNIIGSSDEGGLYDGKYLSGNGNVIVVTVNYRLGVFGFLAHPAFSPENPSVSTGNYGLWDHIQALKWVKQNISFFGGDPDRVLAFGQSAGASNICALLTSPHANGLFSRALMQSLNCYFIPANLVDSTNLVVEQGLGCDISPDKASCLRSSAADDIACIPGASLYYPSTEADFYISIDGYLIPDDPLVSISSGSFNHMPIIAGTTSEEYSSVIELMLSNLPQTQEDLETIVMNWYGAVNAPALIGMYPIALYGTPVWALIAMVSDEMMHCPTRRFVRAAIGHGQPVYRYIFAHAFAEDPVGNAYGAAHGFDVPFVFHTLDEFGITPAAVDLAISDEVIEHWSGFAAVGNPNFSGSDFWPEYQLSDETSHAIMNPNLLVDDFRSAECDLWDSL